MTERVTISLPKNLLAAAKRHWPGNFPSFSAYVQKLMHDDLGITEFAEAAPAVQEPPTPYGTTVTPEQAEAIREILEFIDLMKATGWRPKRERDQSKDQRAAS